MRFRAFHSHQFAIRSPAAAVVPDCFPRSHCSRLRLLRTVYEAFPPAPGWHSAWRWPSAENNCLKMAIFIVSSQRYRLSSSEHLGKRIGPSSSSGLLLLLLVVGSASRRRRRRIRILSTSHEILHHLLHHVLHIRVLKWQKYQ
jgi:MYXO-CTERM domain-containing protein